MLEIFEQQNEGVVLLQKPKKEDDLNNQGDDGKAKSEVLYINNALKNIINCQESKDAISTPFLKVKSEEQYALESLDASSEHFSI